MSRMYRVLVEESISSTIKGSDKVAKKIDMLPILEKGEMGNLLGEELEKDGFERKGNVCEKVENGIKVSVDLEKNEVEVSVEEEKVVTKKKKAEKYVDLDFNHQEKAKDELKNKVCKELEKEVENNKNDLQKEVTKKLEESLRDRIKRINDAATRATGQALKVKASRIGEIKEIHEGENGEVTIKVKV